MGRIVLGFSPYIAGTLYLIGICFLKLLSSTLDLLIPPFVVDEIGTSTRLVNCLGVC